MFNFYTTLLRVKFGEKKRKITLNEFEFAAVSRSAAEFKSAVCINCCIPCTSLTLLLEGIMDKKRQ